MPEIQFEPNKTTIRDMLRNDDYYVIPRFQRPFSWDGDNFADLWRDLTRDDSSGYFIGPMVIWQEPNSHIARVVDGQQRLTTILMMLCAIRDKFAELGETRLVDALQTLIKKRDDDGTEHFSLEVEDGSDYLPRAILQLPPNKALTPQREEEVALSQVLTNIRTEIDTRLGDDPETWLETLTTLRTQLLDLRVILISNDNEDDAYIIFETINSRGKDLEVVDLAKNHLLSLLRGSGNPLADDPRSQWANMRRHLEATQDQRRLNPNRFLQHWWLSRNDYTSEQHLFSEFKKVISDAASARQSLTEVERDAEYYRWTMTPGARTWRQDLYAGSRSLAGLETFGVAQPAPLLLALVRAVETEGLSPKQFNNTLQVIESFHYQYTVVSKLTSSGGVSQMYARAARLLHSAENSPSSQGEALQEIKNKLAQKAPTREQFILSFADRFTYTARRSSDKKFIRYTLDKVTRDQYGNTVLEDPSIEHLLPQDAIRRALATESVVGSIGNLLLVDKTINARDLRNLPYSEKREILLNKSALSNTAGALDGAQWGEDEIRARTQRLAELAFDKIWRMPNPH